MNVYDVESTGNVTGCTYSVVAGSMAMAEYLFMEEYPYRTILEIKLHSDKVLVECEEDTSPSKGGGTIT